MRVLTTAINKGEHKVPEGHKASLYALAPGRALHIPEVGETEVVTIDAAQAKRAEYTYCLKWIEGRTVALFTDDHGATLAQPTKDDPAPRRQRPAREEVERLRAASDAASGLDPHVPEALAPPGAPRPSKLRRRNGPLPFVALRK